MNTTSQSIRVMIADDHLLFRRGLISLIEEQPGLKVVSEASNGKELLEQLRNMEHMPDVLLLDLNMPVMNGIEAIRHLRNMAPDMKIIVLTVHNEERFIIHFVEQGVNGYLLKTVEPDELSRAIRFVTEHDFYFNDLTLQAMRTGTQSKTRMREKTLAAPAGLTAREIEILQLICQEFTAAEIAEKLFLSVRTVEGHRNNLLEKTGSKNAAGLVMFAVRNRIVEPEL
jgi:DNA-binding NarL/FixJ family response regulator